MPERPQVARRDDEVELTTVPQVVRLDGVPVRSDDRERELAGVGETVFGLEGVVVLRHEQAPDRLRGRVGCISGVRRVMTRAADVDRASRRTDDGASGEHAGEHEAERRELDAGVHVDTSYPASSTAAAKSASSMGTSDDTVTRPEPRSMSTDVTPSIWLTSSVTALTQCSHVMPITV